MPIDNRAYTAGHFELSIDGTVTPAYLKSVEGGLAKINSTEAQTGSDPIKIKSTSSREIDGMSLEIGMSEVGPIWLWIAQSWRREFNRKNGHVIHADANYRQQLVHQFSEALIEEVTFPALDAASKDAMFMKLKIRPERVDIFPGDRQTRIFAPDLRKQKLWQSSAFRLRLDRYDTSKVNKIDAFTIKQGIKPVTAGRGDHTSWFPELEPTKIDFPDLKVHMSLHYATTIMEWYRMVVLEGQRETDFETDGAIEFLSPDRKQVLGTVNLYGVGIKSFNVDKSEANTDQLKRCTFDLYVSHMGLNDGDIRMLLEG
jgi:hypothetical protein